MFCNMKIQRAILVKMMKVWIWTHAKSIENVESYEKVNLQCLMQTDWDTISFFHSIIYITFLFLVITVLQQIEEQLIDMTGIKCV